MFLSLNFLIYKTGPIIPMAQECLNGMIIKWYAENFVQGWVYSELSINGNAITIYFLLWLIISRSLRMSPISSVMLLSRVDTTETTF